MSDLPGQQRGGPGHGGPGQGGPGQGGREYGGPGDGGPEVTEAVPDRLPVRLLGRSFKATAKVSLLLASVVLTLGYVFMVVDLYDIPPAVAAVMYYVAVTIQVWIWHLLYGGAAKRRLRAARRRVRIEESRQAVQRAEEDLEHNLRGGPAVTVSGDGNRIHVLPQPRTPAHDEPTGARRPGQAGDEAPHLALAQLWAVTHRRLDLYHNIALEQSHKAFRNAQGAMAIGFVLLAACVVTAVTASTTAGAVAAGSLGAVAAGLAGYVARTFVRSQEAAAAHLRTYFDQPVEFSRYLAAERLVAETTLSAQQREELVAVLVRAMVAGPSGTPPEADA